MFQVSMAIKKAPPIFLASRIICGDKSIAGFETGFVV
jgi:hypothetical protein